MTTSKASQSVPGQGAAGPATTRPWGGPRSGWASPLYAVTFASDTPAGRFFDKALVIAIIGSVLVVFADSMPELHDRHADLFEALEWFFTVLFTVEYLARLICVKQPARYARSFFGVIDLIAVLPTYLALLVPGIHVLVDVRILRLLRIFRIFKLTAYINEYQSLAQALLASSRKIGVFLSVVVLIVVVVGSLMYVIEGPEHGFTSIPLSIYWAVTTMTTVGYGDVTPQTALGRIITTAMMLVGWGTLAVPTGIVTTEMALKRRQHGVLDHPEAERHSALACPACGEPHHLTGARYCHACGKALG